MLRSLGQVEDTLEKWRALLNAENETALLTALTEMNDQRQRWMRDVQLQAWEAQEEPVKESQPGLLRQMFFGNLFGGRRKPGEMFMQSQPPPQEVWHELV